MSEYKIVLTEEMEDFLDLYLEVNRLRPEHARKDYPGVIAHNFITAMMKRRLEFEGLYARRTGKVYDPAEFKAARDMNKYGKAKIRKE